MNKIYFTATPELVKLLGKKWGGTYEVRVIEAPEYIEIWDDVAEETKGKPVPRAKLNYHLFLKSVRHNDEPVEEDIPPKIMEMIVPDVLKLNAHTLDEERELFLQSSTEKPTTKAVQEPNTATT